MKCDNGIRERIIALGVRRRGSTCLVRVEALYGRTTVPARAPGSDVANFMNFGLLRFFCGFIGLLLLPLASSADMARACWQKASSACYFSFQPAHGSGNLHYYASRPPGAPRVSTGPTSALIVVHGHPRDANVTFDAALAAAALARVDKSVLLVAPVFQVAADKAKNCSTKGVPAAMAGDLVWTCSSWIDGGKAENSTDVTAFIATDALVNEVMRQWPSIRVITIAGFSAGAQMVQHYIGFSATPLVPGIALRYVVADPGTWLYFDRPQTAFQTDGQTLATSTCAASGCRTLRSSDGIRCPMANRWKYGMDGLPDALKSARTNARARYVRATVSYMEGALDDGTGPGTFSGVLDRSCAAEAQGTFRLQRGLAYAAYDQSQLAPSEPHPMTIVAGCAHDVTCVWTAPDASRMLFGATR